MATPSTFPAKTATSMSVAPWRDRTAMVLLLLAFFPRRYPGIWELAILNKAALAVTGLILLGHDIQDASTILFSDGTLALIIALAYILTRGYSGWATLIKTSQAK